MDQPPQPSLLSTPLRAHSSPAGDDVFARQRPVGSTPGSRYLNTHISSRSGGGARRHAAPGELPPPPSCSLLDADASLPTPTRPADTAIPFSVREASTASFSAAQAQPQGSGLVVGPGVSEYWVTVFGFPPDFWQPPQHQLRSLLREFSKFGEIFKSGSYSADDANWVHICYCHRDEAERALRFGQQGFMFTSTVIVGVKPLDPHQRASLSEDSLSNPPLLLAPVQPRPPSLVSRPYIVMKPAAGSGTLTTVAPDTSLVWKLQHWAVGL